MSRFFSIGSRIVEDLDEVGSYLQMQNSPVTYSRVRTRSSSKRNLMEHFVHINSLPTRSFLKLPLSRKIALVKNPYLLLPLALENTSAMIGDNLDYFLS
jgi:hypothetical protein